MTRAFDHRLHARRDAEYAATRNAAELEVLQRRWAAEDTAAEAAADWQVATTQDLRRRLARLEKALGTDGRKLIDAIVPALGDALKELRRQERAHYMAELDRRGYVTYRGTWDAEQAYQRGAMITHAGATWIAITPCAAGDKPGRAPAWRMCAKGSSNGPSIA